MRHKVNESGTGGQERKYAIYINGKLFRCEQSPRAARKAIKKLQRSILGECDMRLAAVRYWFETDEIQVIRELRL